jgi:integrase/recombinase XerD
MGPLRFELKSIAPEGSIKQAYTPVDEKQVNEYLSIRKIQGICDRWVYQTRVIIDKYLAYTDGTLDKQKTLKYIEKLKENHSLTTYRKRTYAIRKFLIFLKIEWADQLHPPPEQKYIPIHVPKKQIEQALNYFKDSQYYLQARALIHLGKDSGARAEELYQLSLENIDLENRIVHIIHNPRIGKTTKTKVSRKSFFTPETKKVLEDYIKFYNNDNQLKDLFGQSHLTRLFRPSPIQVKLLRKNFSQQWDKRNGPTGAKKIIMGHSLHNDVDLSHYNYLNTEDLQQIYDIVMCNSSINEWKHSLKQ